MKFKKYFWKCRLRYIVLDGIKYAPRYVRGGSGACNFCDVRKICDEHYGKERGGLNRMCSYFIGIGYCFKKVSDGGFEDEKSGKLE